MKNTTRDGVLKERLGQSVLEGVQVRRNLWDRCAQDIVAAARMVCDAIAAKNKLLLIGNGGSAADAQHIAAEFVGRFVNDRIPLPAIALTVDSSALTAIANDYGYDVVFSRQVEALGNPGDVLVAISTSGRSPSVLRAVEAARARGMKVIGLTGGKGIEFAKLCDACVVVPSMVTARIQECHITVGHLLCEAVDLELGALPAGPTVGRTYSSSNKELDLDALVALRATWKREGRTVVWTNGNFDVLHVGHLQSLKAARQLGDVLVVGVNTDETVREKKGPNRPVFPVADRVEMLAALDCVDHVLVFEEATPERVLSELEPDIHCKGADYAPPNGAPIPEAELVRSYGGRVEFLPLVPARSSTSTLQRLLESE